MTRQLGLQKMLGLNLIEQGNHFCGIFVSILDQANILCWVTSCTTVKPLNWTHLGPVILSFVETLSL